MPAALHAEGRLAALVTDAWAPAGSLAGRLPSRLGGRLAERGDPALARACVHAFTGALLAFEARARLFGPGDNSGWAKIIARNDWFQAHAAAWLHTGGLLDVPAEGRPVIFAYSYAAGRILEAARTAGCVAVLGQIDAGPLEEEIVAEAVARHPDLCPRWNRAPARYWRAWREECHLADRIVVNSHWTRAALTADGIEAEKVRVVPLAYEPPPATLGNGGRVYPERFTAARPLRVLFLGALIVRKGIAEMLGAMRALRGEPVELWCVGPEGVVPTTEDRDNPQLRWIGPVARRDVHRYYREADVFAFPTLSDGFGLTQLEAQAWGLPVITSRNCGEVIREGVSGLVMEEVTVDAVVATIRTCLGDPAALVEMSSGARLRAADFRPAAVLPQMLACTGELCDGS